MERTTGITIVWPALAVAGLLAAAFAGGCDGGSMPEWKWEPTPEAATGEVRVPEPIDLLLPRSINIHPLTGTRVFGEAGDIQGIDLRVEALDAYEDKTKAFGQFRFELYQFAPNSPDPRGPRVAVWVKDLSEPDANRLHWQKHHRMYQFKLEWLEPIPIGSKFVIEAVFQSRFTPRLYDRHVFISGE